MTKLVSHTYHQLSIGGFMLNRYAFTMLAMISAMLIFAQTTDSQINPLPPSNSFLFDSQPPLTAQVGVPYIYTIHLIPDSTAVIRYYADRMNPPGLSVDSVSGVVSWTPAVRGWFSLSLGAVVRYKTHSLALIAVQRFMVAVAGGNGIVQGKVTDTLNVGIPNVVVEVLQAASPNLPDGGCYAYAAKTDNSGNYRIAGIDPGVYKFHAVSPSPQYASQWYDGKTNPSDANKISIADTPAVTIVSFILRGGAVNLPKVTLSGSVTDSAHLAVKNSGVFFVRAGFALNSNISLDDFRKSFELNEGRGDFRLEGNSPHVYPVKVDSLGNYSLQIPQGSYIAFAKAPGYATAFYLDQSDLLSATVIELQNDSAGINFTLSKLPPVVLGTIKGSVLDSTGHDGIPSRVIASRDRWLSKDKFSISRSYVVDTDSLGAYTFDQLLPGSYFVFAVPLGNYVPAFYSTDSANAKWKRATRVVIDGNNVTGIDIYVHNIPTSLNGYANISGTVHLPSGSASTMAGAIVYAIRNNVAAGFAITDTKGNYNIDGIAPGTYTVTVDRLGYTETASKTGTVTYNATGTPGNAIVDLALTPTSVGQTSTAQPEQFTLAQNYPNPFNPSTTIEYSLDRSGIVTLKIYNILGQEVTTLVNGFQNAGSYRAVFNASSLSSGIYFYRLQSEKLSQTQKMILMK
jgi:Secretion system C-terminal sorting domain/Carboxypeptidase regulatory-like domain